MQGQTLDLTAANTWKLGWVYDRYGNRSQQNLLGGTISVTQPQLSIDPQSNRITTSGFSYDAAGNLIADGTGNTYAYDAENQLMTVNGGSTASYSYDGRGLRVKKVVGSTTTAYVFSGAKVIAEYANGALNARYVYAGSQLLATVGGGTTYHYPDHLSARLETNASGTVNRTFGHLPFGETWYETGTAIKWKFTSYERDTESGLDYAMFRYDSSRLARFMTADLLAGSSDDPQSLNRYAYVRNMPIDAIDPMGLDDDFWACFLDVSSNGHCGGPGQSGPIGGSGWGTNFYLGYSQEEARHDQIITTGLDPLIAPTGPEWREPGLGDSELIALGCKVHKVTEQIWCPGTGGSSRDSGGTLLPVSAEGSSGGGKTPPKKSNSPNYGVGVCGSLMGPVWPRSPGCVYACGFVYDDPFDIRIGSVEATKHDLDAACGPGRFCPKGIVVEKDHPGDTEAIRILSCTP